MNPANTTHSSSGDRVERASSASPPAIRVEHLTKRYAGRAVVDDLSLTVVPGEIFAVLGPNGAGKTTTIEILEGYRTAESGTVRVLGLDPQRDGTALKPQIGVMLQTDGVYPALRAREVLDLFAAFYANPQPPGELLERVGLDGAPANERCRALSGGQKRRLALALALVGRPRLLFLDEPTTGMDPQARRATWELLRDLKERGTTILLTTHFMDEAERLADRIAILDEGRVIALDTPAGLTGAQSTAATEVRLRLDGAVEAGALAKLPSARAARLESVGEYVIETEDAPTLVVELATLLRDGGLQLRELRVGKSSLEDVFLRLTGKEMRE